MFSIEHIIHIYYVTYILIYINIYSTKFFLNIKYIKNLFIFLFIILFALMFNCLMAIHI